MTSEVGEGAAVTRSGASKGILQAETVIAGFEFRFEGESRRHTLLSAYPRCANSRLQAMRFKASTLVAAIASLLFRKIRQFGEPLLEQAAVTFPNIEVKPVPSVLSLEIRETRCHLRISIAHLPHDQPTIK
jgi:hypothetical protein